jgi:translation initiation factor IF-2
VRAFASKKEAESSAQATKNNGATIAPTPVYENDTEKTLIPLIIKADVAGSLDAVKHEIGKLADDRVELKVIGADVGAISENDIKRAGGDARVVVLGFNVAIENGVNTTAERAGVTLYTNTIIYKLSEWLAELMQERRPKRETLEQHGTARVLKTFSQTRTKQIIGARVEEGTFKVGGMVQVLRRGEEIGKGKIVELQHGKKNVGSVDEGTEFGTKIDATIEIAQGDTLIEFVKVER